MSLLPCQLSIFPDRLCKSQNGVLMGRSVSLPACLPGTMPIATSVFKRLWRQPYFLILPRCNSLAKVLDCLELAEIIQTLYFYFFFTGSKVVEI